MISEREIRERLAGYLAGNESVDDFANWLSRESPSVRYQDNRAFDIVASIQNRVDVYFDSVIDEVLLRNELASLVRSNEIVHEAKATLVYVASFHNLDDLVARSSPLRPQVRAYLNSPVHFGAMQLA